MDFFTDALGALNFVMMALVYLAIIVGFLGAKGGFGKLHYVIIIAGFFILTDLFGVYYSTFLILAWLILNGMTLMVSRNTALFLLFLTVVLPPGNMLFYVFALLVRIIMIFGFLYYTLVPKKNIA